MFGLHSDSFVRLLRSGLPLFCAAVLIGSDRLDGSAGKCASER